jgi:hypothetical protein
VAGTVDFHIKRVLGLGDDTVRTTCRSGVSPLPAAQKTIFKADGRRLMGSDEEAAALTL